jgi:putative tricarboxylic transport membrane protein
MKLDHASGIVVALLGAGVTVVSWTLPFTDSATTLGPGMFPFVLGLLLVFLGIAMFCSASFATMPEQTLQAAFARSALRRPACAVALLVVSVVLFETAGFAISILVLLIGFLRIFGGYSWGRAIAIAVVSTAAFYALFGLALKVPIALLPNF